MAQKPFHVLLYLAITIFLLTIAGCEKSDYYDDDTTKNNTEQVDNTKNNSGGSTKNNGGGSSNDDNGDGYYDDNDDYGGGESGTQSDTLTVEQFIYGDVNGGAFVKGYVIGDCTKSFKYAEFEPPFTNPQALLLADNMNERDKGNIISVQLKSGTKARAHMNLVDNPGWYGQQIVLFGYRTKYLGMVGIKDLGAYPLYNP